MMTIVHSQGRPRESRCRSRLGTLDLQSRQNSARDRRWLRRAKPRMRASPFSRRLPNAPLRQPWRKRVDKGRLLLLT